MSIFENTLKKFGVDVTFFTLTEADAWRAAATSKTRILSLEVSSNPLNTIAELTELATMSRDLDAILSVDNCFCTPALKQPLALGADIVTHSATEYLGG